MTWNKVTFRRTPAAETSVHAQMTESVPDLAALYLQHREAMYRVAASVLRGAGRAAEAADVVQDAIVSIMNSPPSGVRNWEAVLVTAAKRKALDFLKSALVTHAGPALEDDDEGELSFAHPAVDVEEEVQDLLENERRAAVLRECLRTLDERHRRVVWDIQVSERSRAEVAEELGVTPPRISQMMTKALAQLRDELGKQEGVEL